jgi:hypothetical protein
VTARRKSKVGGKRKGAGRPRKGDDARSVVRTLKLTPAEATTQDEFAKSQATTWPDMVREAIELALARGSTR